jgi:flagellar basal-body rod modification protein FlgD
MTIAAVNSLNIPTATTNTGTVSAAGITSSLNIDFTTYLKILTTQLQNQDPTDATDPNQFTQELIQIEQVNVQNSTNTDLQNLTAASSTNSLSSGIGYVGAYVQADTSTGAFSLQNGEAQIGYSLPSATSSTTVTVQDSTGKTVAAFSGGTAAGGNYVVWDGKGLDGTTLADGAYTFNVTSNDVNGNSITASNPVALFRITAVQSASNGTLQLLAGGISLSSADVTDVFAPTTLPTATKGTDLTTTT